MWAVNDGEFRYPLGFLLIDFIIFSINFINKNSDGFPDVPSIIDGPYSKWVGNSKSCPGCNNVINFSMFCFSKKAGQDVLINGFGIGTDHFGGFSEKASVCSDWLMPLPSGLTHLDAAKIGTAGYTAMLCVDAIKQGVYRNTLC